MYRKYPATVPARRRNGPGPTPYPQWKWHSLAPKLEERNPPLIASGNLKIIYQRQTGNFTQRAQKTKAEGECFAPLFKIYLEIIFFSCLGYFQLNFSPPGFQKLIFCTFFNFLHFGAECKKNYPKHFGIHILILFDQIIGLGCLENDTRGFLIIFDISIPNLQKTS